MSPHNRLAGVIFDLDGVIVDSAALHRGSRELLAEEHGLQMTEQLFHETLQNFCVGCTRVQASYSRRRCNSA